MKITAAIIVTAMICVPVMATLFQRETPTINVAGSTTVQPLMLELQKEFEKFADVQMNVTGGGSGVGISSTLNGVSDIGMLSRDLKPGESQGILVEHIIAMDAVVVIVNIEAGLGPAPDLTLRDLVDIYSGAKTDWSELGGNSRGIAVIGREEGSGTRDCFDSALKKEDKNFKIKDTVNSVNSTGAVLAAVSTIPGAIGYINLNISTESYGTIQKATLNGVTASPSTVLDTNESTKYKMSRDLVLVTRGEPTGMVEFFINWVLSKTGQDIVERCGFVRVDGR